MPGARRKRKGQIGRRPNAQLRSGGVAPGKPDSYDDRKNTNAGTPPEKKLDVEGPARVIRTA